MNTVCQPLPQSVIEEMLQIAAQSMCDRAGDTPEQRASRTRQMVYAILGFEPRDGLEYMLATMVVGHFQLILQAMHEALWGQSDSIKARTRTGIVSLDRAMLSFVRELRLIRQRPLARWAEDAKRDADVTSAPIKTPEWVAEWAGMPEPVAENVPDSEVKSAAAPPVSDDAATAKHIAEFEAALATLSATLEEARTLDPIRVEAVAGD
jgi:hypothetical protein